MMITMTKTLLAFAAVTVSLMGSAEAKACQTQALEQQALGAASDPVTRPDLKGRTVRVVRWAGGLEPKGARYHVFLVDYAVGRERFKVSYTMAQHSSPSVIGERASDKQPLKFKWSHLKYEDIGDGASIVSGPLSGYAVLKRSCSDHAPKD